MGGKRTSELIPLCHPISLTDLVVAVTPDRKAGVLRIRAEAATVGQTGVEMEALTAASVAALTIYDMVKGVEKGVEIRALRLVSKTGGKSGLAQPSKNPRGRGRAIGAQGSESGPVSSGQCAGRLAVRDTLAEPFQPVAARWVGNLDGGFVTHEPSGVG